MPKSLIRVLITFSIFVVLIFSFNKYLLSQSYGKFDENEKVDPIIFDSNFCYFHKSGFYINKNGDIFQLNNVSEPDSNNKCITSFWLDSTLFFGEYPNKKALKEVIDLTTYQQLENDYYAKDTCNVYYAYPTSGGLIRTIVQNANPYTFNALAGRYGKDDKHIYYQGEILIDADLNSFKVIGIGDSAYDNKHKYYSGEIINEE